jgi:uncharacterized pyridoxamine 5'-phosphate oxidase family protein/Pyruvate/2-oxoacid:ferredoxin oxidoreductase delta subunit
MVVSFWEEYMDETARKALKLLREIKSVTCATLNNNEPAARIADVMLFEEEGLYFVTAKGKPFYKQLKNHPRLALCGINKDYVSVRLVGDIRFCNDRAVVDRVFEFNPVLDLLYLGEKRHILEAFHMFRGKGEMFDLSVGPPRRERFAFGGEKVNPSGYEITDKCTACGACAAACPVQVISDGEIHHIDRGGCLECGSCADVCPEDAIESAQGL